MRKINEMVHRAIANAEFHGFIEVKKIEQMGIVLLRQLRIISIVDPVLMRLLMIVQFQTEGNG